MNQRQFYKSGPWKRARAAYIAYRKSIDGGMCEVCGERPGYIVHHKIWLDDEKCNDPDIALNPENFRYECQTCHNREIDPERCTAGGRIRYGPDGEIINIGTY